ncbi:uncharacterized protein [Arachis hypogaea]|uniref:uncharacterized protein isoform X1 n=1 Tax=Arachis hypogaea TaxID=3818 RepID=UPI003B21FE0B
MLTEFNASKNLLNGIPDSIGGLSRLIRLDLHQNSVLFEQGVNGFLFLLSSSCLKASVSVLCRNLINPFINHGLSFTCRDLFGMDSSGPWGFARANEGNPRVRSKFIAPCYYMNKGSFRKGYKPPSCTEEEDINVDEFKVIQGQFMQPLGEFILSSSADSTMCAMACQLQLHCNWF